MRGVIAFDVNETLLDLGALDPQFARVFGDAAARREWFNQVIELAITATASNVYFDFGVVGDAALTMVAARRNVELSPTARAGILRGMRALPPHPDARPGLERLRAAGFRLAALTNSSIEVEEAQLRNAKLGDLFEKALSADSGKRLKPAVEAYENAARDLGVATREIRMVATHVWDVQGALRAGCAAAFVERPGAVWNPLLERPDIVGPDLGAIP